MKVTSDYYRCRALRTTYSTESLTLFGASSATDTMPKTTAAIIVPLRPSKQTLRRLANLYKNEHHNRVA